MKSLLKLLVVLFLFFHGQVSYSQDYAPQLMQIQIINNIRFAVCSDQIFSRSFPELSKISDNLNRNPMLNALFIGHTDNVGSKRYNARLSRKRAIALCNFMTNNGVREDNVRYLGFGEKYPIETNETEEGRARNRRMEVIFFDYQSIGELDIHSETFEEDLYKMVLNNMKNNKLSVVSQNKNLKCKVFPNPTANFITVDFGALLVQPLTIQLFDNQGHAVYKIETRNSKETFDLSQFSAGIYYLKVFDNQLQELFTKQILKN